MSLEKYKQRENS